MKDNRVKILNIFGRHSQLMDEKKLLRFLGNYGIVPITNETRVIFLIFGLTTVVVVEEIIVIFISYKIIKKVFGHIVSELEDIPQGRIV